VDWGAIDHEQYFLASLHKICSLQTNTEEEKQLQDKPTLDAIRRDFKAIWLIHESRRGLFGVNQVARAFSLWMPCL